MQLSVCLKRTSFNYKTPDKLQTLIESRHLEIMSSEYLGAIKKYQPNRNISR